MHADRGAPGSRPHPMALRELLAGIIDYAGLFPPAQLEMQDAVQDYAAHRSGTDAWALGRFVVPARRLEELAVAVASLGRGAGEASWRVSALVGPELAGDLERIRAFDPPRFGGGPAAVVDVVEMRVASTEIESRLREISPGPGTYVEIPVEADPRESVAALARASARAKIRTGGVTPEAFPAPVALLRFLRACVEADLPFKATAGLHHPVAGRYRLTHDPGSPTAAMYGYLNLLFATALLRRDAPEDRVAAVLAETEVDAFHFDDEFASWGEHHLDREEIRALRDRGMVAFGSCSFREPLDELRTGAPARSLAGPRQGER